MLIELFFFGWFFMAIGYALASINIKPQIVGEIKIIERHAHVEEFYCDFEINEYNCDKDDKEGYLKYMINLSMHKIVDQIKPMFTVRKFPDYNPQEERYSVSIKILPPLK